jgi:dTDP-4-dehydrorhamnose reductase
MRGDNFVTKVLRWAREKETLRIVVDQISNPTWSRMVTEMTASILARGADYIKERTGLYNLAAGGQASRFEWAREILRLDPRRDEQITREVIPAAANEFTMPASRPPFSALDGSAFSNDFKLAPPDWQQSLKLATMD